MNTFGPHRNSDDPRPSTSVVGLKMAQHNKLLKGIGFGLPYMLGRQKKDIRNEPLIKVKFLYGLVLMKRPPLSILITIFVFAFCCNRIAAENYSAEIVIYGGTSSAVMAAVEAKKLGKSVIVVSPDKYLGGLTSGGLG